MASKNEVPMASSMGALVLLMGGSAGLKFQVQQKPQM